MFLQENIFFLRINFYNTREFDLSTKVASQNFKNKIKNI